MEAEAFRAWQHLVSWQAVGPSLYPNRWTLKKIEVSVKIYSAYMIVFYCLEFLQRSSRSHTNLCPEMYANI